MPSKKYRKKKLSKTKPKAMANEPQIAVEEDVDSEVHESPYPRAQKQETLKEHFLRFVDETLLMNNVHYYMKAAQKDKSAYGKTSRTSFPCPFYAFCQPSPFTIVFGILQLDTLMQVAVSSSPSTLPAMPQSFKNLKISMHHWRSLPYMPM